MRDYVGVSIKGVDEDAFRNLKLEDARNKSWRGCVGSFRIWVASKRRGKIRDEERMLEAARDMDKLREGYKGKSSGVAEIRKWRDKKKQS